VSLRECEIYNAGYLMLGSCSRLGWSQGACSRRDKWWGGESRRRRRLGGVDVHGKNLRLQFPRLLLLWLRCFLVLLDVEFPQKHNGLFAKDAAGNRVGLVDAGAVER